MTASLYEGYLKKKKQKKKNMQITQASPAIITFPSLQTNIDSFANSTDPDETVRFESSYQDLHVCQSVIEF